MRKAFSMASISANSVRMDDCGSWVFKSSRSRQRFKILHWVFLELDLQAFKQLVRGFQRLAFPSPFADNEVSPECFDRAGRESLSQAAPLCSSVN